MVDSRDDFPPKIKEVLAKRVGNRCSNPSCCQLTSGPHTNAGKAVNVGVAAHITAASPRGPRYDNSLSSQQRKSIENGVWLCQNCAKLIDNDTNRYTVKVLYAWKQEAEEAAIREIEGENAKFVSSNSLIDKRIEAYRKLFDKIKTSSGIINDLFDKEEISKEARQKAAINIILEIAKLTDSEQFFLDHEVIVHTVGSFVGLEDIFDIDDLVARQAEVARFRKNIRNAFRMIESIRDTGKLDRSIKSPIIEYFSTLKQYQDKEDQVY